MLKLVIMDDVMNEENNIKILFFYDIIITGSNQSKHYINNLVKWTLKHINNLFVE